MKVSFEGRSAIVTGAGGGIGAAIAKELARRGASVVVNDYGGPVDGSQAGSIDRAEAIVEEIRAEGGIAIADGTAVGTDAAAGAVIQSALEAFGRIDVLVNNAGIAGGGGMEVQDEAVFGRLLKVHVAGAQALMRGVWPLMRDAGYGRIVNTLSSAAFGLGYLGGYAAGKGGLMSLTRDAGFAGAPHNIRVNGFLPTADTRMTRQIQEDDLRDWIIAHFQPEKVAQAVAFLASEQIGVSGEMFSVGGGRVARVAFAMARGFYDPAITAESLGEGFDRAMDFADSSIVYDVSSEQDSYLADIPGRAPLVVPAA